MGRTGRIPNGRPSSVSKSTGPRPAAQRSRDGSPRRRRRSPRGRPGRPRRRRARRAARGRSTGRLPAEAGWQQAARLRPVARQLTVCGGTHPSDSPSSRWTPVLMPTSGRRRDSFGARRTTTARARRRPGRTTRRPSRIRRTPRRRGSEDRGARCGRARRPPRDRVLHAPARRSRRRLAAELRRARSGRPRARAGDRRAARRSRGRAAGTRTAPDAPSPSCSSNAKGETRRLLQLAQEIREGSEREGSQGVLEPR